jgi:hypothetical protein
MIYLDRGPWESPKSEREAFRPRTTDNELPTLTTLLIDQMQLQGFLVGYLTIEQDRGRIWDLGFGIADLKDNHPVTRFGIWDLGLRI